MTLFRIVRVNGERRDYLAAPHHNEIWTPTHRTACTWTNEHLAERCADDWREDGHTVAVEEFE